MDPMITSALISGGANFLGGIMGDNSANKATKKAIHWNLVAAKNAHRWQVEDLRAAGLNPRLSAMGGSGASMAAAPVARTNENILGEAANSAISAARVREEITNMKETNKQIVSQTMLNKAQEKVAQASAKSISADAHLKHLSVPAAENDASFQKTIEEAGPFVKWLNQLLQGGATAKSIIGK